MESDQQLNYSTTLPLEAENDSVSPISIDNESVNISTFDTAAYIAQYLGPQRVELKVALPMTLLYCFLWLCGMAGNVTTCLVVIRNRYMRNQTYIYLTNLAITDILTLLVAMPLEVYSMWHQYPWTFGEYVCDVKTVLTEAVTCASILTVVTFTVERYLAICHPLLLATHSKAHRAFCIILGIWTFGIAYSIPWIIPTKVNYLTHPQSGASIPESAWCAIPFQDMSKAKIPLIMMIVTTLLFFVMPFIVVTTLYCRIGKSMKSSCSLTSCTCRGSVDCSVCDAEQRGHKSRKTVIRMLMTVVICFFLCWSPYHTQRLVFATLTLTGGWNTQTTYIHYYLWLASGIGYYVSCCINPLVYCVMSRRFRRGLKNVSNCMASSSNSSIATGMGNMIARSHLKIKVQAPKTSHPPLPSLSFRKRGSQSILSSRHRSKPDPPLTSPTSMPLSWRWGKRKTTNTSTERNGSEVTSGRLFVTHHKKRRVIVHEELSDKYFSESGHREHSTPDIPTHQEPRADIAVLQ